MTYAQMLGAAATTLAAPPARSHIVRPEPHGEVLGRAVLPLELCQTTNRTRHGQAWALGRAKQLIFAALFAQLRRRAEPLPGRPQVLLVRLSAVEPDRYSDWGKAAVDALCCPTARSRMRLGWLRDDRPQDAEIEQWWEPAGRGDGLVYLEIRSGLLALPSGDGNGFALPQREVTQ